METKTTAWSEFTKGGTATVEQTLGQEEQKSRTVRITARGPIKKVDHWSEVGWEKVKQSLPVYDFH